MRYEIRLLTFLTVGLACAGCATSKAVPSAVITTVPVPCAIDGADRASATYLACSGSGRYYTHDDISRTGATTLGQALPLLDPSITVTH